MGNGAGAEDSLDLLGHHGEVDASAPHGQPHRGRVITHQKSYPAERTEERLLPDVEPVRVLAGDQLAVVGIRPVEQSGPDLDRSQPEGDLVDAGGYFDPASVVVCSSRKAGQPLQLDQRAGRHEDLRRVRDGLRVAKVTQCEAIGIRGHQSDHIFLGRHQDPGQQWPGVVCRRRPDHLAEPVNKSRTENMTRLVRVVRRRKLHHRKGPELEVRPRRRNLDPLLARLQGHRAGLQRADDFCGQPGRNHSDDFHARSFACSHAFDTTFR